MKLLRYVLISMLMVGLMGCGKPSLKQETAETLQKSYKKMKSLNQIIEVNIESHNQGQTKKLKKTLELINTYNKGTIKDLRSKETKVVDDGLEEIMQFVSLDGVAQIKLKDQVYEQNTPVTYPLHYGNVINWMMANIEQQDFIFDTENNEMTYVGNDTEVVASFIKHFNVQLSGAPAHLKVNLKLSEKQDLIEILEFRLASNYNENTVKVDGLGIFREKNQPVDIKLFR